MLWLLRAEFRKLVRPLVWGAGLAIVGFCLLITWGAANNARGALASPKIPGVCDRSVSPQCRQVIEHAHAAARAAAAATSSLAQPGQIGHVAVGMLASVPGLLLIALIAGGHWGGEWGSRTIRQLLSREGRRTRVLAAKWLTIWAAAVLTMLCCWLVLVVAAPVITAGAGLPAAHVSLWAGIGSSVSAAGHAVVVLGLFSAVATAAGTIARGQLATTAITAGSMLLALLVAGITSIGRLSPASFVRMPRLDGIEATRRLVALTPKPPRVVLLTTFDLDEYVFDGLLAGASGFLLKHAPPEEILLAVRAAAAGDALVSPAPMRRLVEHFVRGRPRTSADLARLTEREREVLVLMARGLSNAAIARTLVIAETTAKTHVTRVLAKLGLRDRAHAVVYGYETGLVRPGEHTQT